MGKRYLTTKIWLALLLALAAVTVVAVVAQPAAAYSQYEHGGIAQCNVCHTVNTSTPPTNAQCAACHTNYVALVAPPNADGTCWSCHTPGQDMSAVKTNAAVGGCGTSAKAAGCHNVAAPHVGTTLTTCVTCHYATVSTTVPGSSVHHGAALKTKKPMLTIKLAAASVKVKTAIKASGLAFPKKIGKVTVTVQRKVGTKWVKVGTPKVVTPTAAFKWSYVTFKPAIKGTYRMQAKTAAVAGEIPAGLVTSKNCIAK